MLYIDANVVWNNSKKWKITIMLVVPAEH
jgi:hypothetical protein